MKLGLLITSIGNFGKKGFYNAQEIGLAKALDSLADEVIVYKLVPIGEMKRTERLENCCRSSVMFIPAKSVGINGVFDTAVLDKSLDALIYFSDTQFCVPKVYRWAKRNNVKFFPYIGVTESHSVSKPKKAFVNQMFKRNLKIYRKCKCFVKTPAVSEELKKLGVSDTVLTPVGLDLSLMKADYEKYDSVELKKKYGFNAEDKVLLFIGRLIEEKQPLEMIEIFSEVCEKDSLYRLLMVGSGELKARTESLIKEKGLQSLVRMIEKIPNKDIWELYRLADCFVNLNRQEIFGMAILEAMYYGCKVVAREAPGPNFIIKDGVTGYLADSNDAVLEGIMRQGISGQSVHDETVNNFTWKSTAKIIIDCI